MGDFFEILGDVLIATPFIVLGSLTEFLKLLWIMIFF